MRSGKLRQFDHSGQTAPFPAARLPFAISSSIGCVPLVALWMRCVMHRAALTLFSRRLGIRAQHLCIRMNRPATASPRQREPMPTHKEFPLVLEPVSTLRSRVSSKACREQAVVSRRVVKQRSCPIVVGPCQLAVSLTHHGCRLFLAGLAAAERSDAASAGCEPHSPPSAARLDCRPWRSTS